MGLDSASFCALYFMGTKPGSVIWTGVSPFRFESPRYRSGGERTPSVDFGNAGTGLVVLRKYYV